MFYLKGMKLTRAGYCSNTVEIIMIGGIDFNNSCKKTERHFAQMAPVWM
jgi:hypothetical protein